MQPGGSGIVHLEIPGVGIAARAPEAPDGTSRTLARVQGKPPLRRNFDRADREAGRILGSIQNNFSLSGTAVGSERWIYIYLPVNLENVDKN